MLSLQNYLAGLYNGFKPGQLRALIAQGQVGWNITTRYCCWLEIQMQGQISKEQQQSGALTPEQLQLRHKNQVKSAFCNYATDLRQQEYTLFSHTPLNQYYQANRQRKAIMLQQAIRHNQNFLDQIIQYINYVEEEDHFHPDQFTSPNNRSKIKTTVKQFYRQWCGESKEKDDYTRIVGQARNYLRPGDNVLIPGCGLGRLVYEFVRAGFGAEGNQVTYFMLFGSNFIINAVQQKQQFKIFPFISSHQYYYDQEDAFRSVMIPDVSPSQEMEGVQQQPNFAISAGEFTQIYWERPKHFDGVATCFFLDTANNIFEYVNTIAHTLKDSGIWVNFGPLLFHYRELQNQVSIEVSWQILRDYIAKHFQFLQEQVVETTYCHDPKSDMAVAYQCISFVCKKKLTSPPLQTSQ